MPSSRQRSITADSSFVKVSLECWDFWGALIEDLHKNHGFPAGTLETLNGYLSIFRGEGSTFRLETEQHKMFLDAIRQGDIIVAIIDITLISKLDNDKARTGWVIARPCNVHSSASTSGSVKREASPDEDADHAKPACGHCCVLECAGPFKEAKWKMYDTTRLGIVSKILEQEVIMLRNESKELMAVIQQAKSSDALLAESERENRKLREKNSKLKKRVEILKAEGRELSDEDHGKQALLDQNRALREEAKSQQQRITKLERELERSHKAGM
ncbi:hypothetical protein ACHAQH_008624 [Verticillium albo-atrum]